MTFTETHHPPSRSASRGRGRYTRSSSRRHELRSRSPGEISAYAQRQKVLLAGLALGIALVTFVVGLIPPLKL